MRLVEQALITTMSLEAATKLIDDETVALKAMMDVSYTPAAEKGLLHLQYSVLEASWSVFVLIKVVIIDVLPAIFEQYRIRRKENEHICEWVMALPGGQRLWKEKKVSHVVLPPVASNPKMQEGISRQLTSFTTIKSPPLYLSLVA